MIGKTLAHREIISRLGKGERGKVFRAKGRKLGRARAISGKPVDFLLGQ